FAEGRELVAQVFQVAVPAGPPNWIGAAVWRPRRRRFVAVTGLAAWRGTAEPGPAALVVAPVAGGGCRPLGPTGPPVALLRGRAVVRPVADLGPADGPKAGGGWRRRRALVVRVAGADGDRRDGGRDPEAGSWYLGDSRTRERQNGRDEQPTIHGPTLRG